MSHLQILEGQGLLQCSSNKTQGIGFSSFWSTSFKVNIIALKLTAQGHQSESDLVKPGVVEKLKTSLKDSELSETVKIYDRVTKA
ncbi:hypothetical protein OW492_03110 [Psychromonas sp. 14N.309.X.WAT.B.A12]|uniref:hypothetical protein n=1 Tax=Psychromonas sp. 14N.309.X.WAT.B.A12 TaxID=2998322 RepID=UPI0025B26A2A|nr:hypothetical protein [Psychromonas sp. 14N.309.X.WAT.B.A12]MDN2662364.1 hypothetical protein [Psychromonas sp. 14N.309.X.WAT.B.A12]